MNNELLYRVRFSRPDGIEAWLGESHCGPTDDPEKSPAVGLALARSLAEERNKFHGTSGYRYWPVAVVKGESHGTP